MTGTVADVIHEGVQTVTPDDRVKHAAVVMEACEIGPLPVCENHRLIGMVTDRDITVRAVATGRDPNTTTVREVMTADQLVTCRSDQALEEGVELMREHQVRRLPVVDADRRVVGIVALADVARHADPGTKSDAVTAVSQPTETEGT